MYAESVEEIVGKPIIEAVEGKASSFHGSGREDIDARMLGTGRPFVIEIARPRKRFLDLGKLEESVNSYGAGKVEVSGLKLADRDVVRKLKQGENAQKQYRVMMSFGRQVNSKELKDLEQALSYIRIRQRTPLRVMHRRADLTREKYIYDVKVKRVSSKKAEMEVRCQGGLYVKELVSGDEGRTTPSVAEILKTSAQPLKLDVLNVILGD
jgi:tRNA pseudouridine synthase 10